MKRLTLRTENQWRGLKDGAGVDLLRASFVCNALQAGAAITLAGFGIGLTWWAREWGEGYPSSVSLRYPDNYPACVGDSIDLCAGEMTPVQSWASVKSYAWEPIETDGWAGEPEQGMEHAP